MALTKVQILDMPLENDYKHTIRYSSLQEQENYMTRKVIKTFEGLSYQRKDFNIRLPVSYDEAINYKYLRYKNVEQNQKWFYAFITKLEYKGDDLTIATIETDVLQTYMFNYQVQQSFVEREHTADDTIGANTIPENLECGEFVCHKYDKDSNLTDLLIVWGATANTLGNDVAGGRYGGIYSGVTYWAINNGSAMNEILKQYAEKGKNEAIQCLFMAPKFLTNFTDGSAEVENSETINKYDYILSKQNFPYIVRNNKLKTFPYRYLLASNNNGGSAIYKYEFFNSETMNFEVQGVLTPGCSIRLIPKDYKGVTGLNNEEGLNCGKYPICNWNSDVFTNWLTQNSVNIGVNLAVGAGQVIVGTVSTIASGGTAGAIGGATAVSGVSKIADTLMQIHQMNFTPPQSNGNINCGDVITGGKENTFHFYQMGIKEEYAKIIDDYFDMFGYKTNRVKIPNKNHRESWWYTKTIDVNISGTDIPLNDLQKIKECYNNGITFWVSGKNFKDYSQPNGIW